MDTSLNLGGGTSQDHTARQTRPAGSAEEAYDRREKLHLGLGFHIAGDLRNWTRGWSDDTMTKELPTELTRVLCLNVGGGSGTLKDPDKLAFIAFTLIQQRIHVACLTESRIRRNDLTAALKSIGLERQFRAFGLNGQISWLVHPPVLIQIGSVFEGCF
jgi:hypothetical protein